MSYFILFCLFLTVYFDVKTCRGYHPEICRETFFAPRPTILTWALVCLLLIIVQSVKGHVDLIFLPLLGMPLYLLRRNRFLQDVEKFEGQGRPENTPSEGYVLFRIKSDAWGIVLAWFMILIVLHFLVQGLAGIWPVLESELAELIVTAVLSSAMILTLVYKASGRFSDQGFLSNVGLRRGDRSLFKVAVVPALLGLAFAWCSAWLLLSRHVQPSTPLSEVIESTQSSGLLLLFLAVAVLAAPFVEEVIFRGYFFHVLNKIKGQRLAVIVIAFAFAALHFGQYWGDWAAIGMVTLLGFTLTILRAVTGTTIAGVVFHYVYNAGVTLIPVVMMLLSNPPYFEYRAYFPYHDTATKERLLKASIERQPDLAEAYNDLAWIYAGEDRNLDEALELVEVALSYDPEEYAFWDTKAEVLFKSERYEESMAVREVLLQKDIPEQDKAYQLRRLNEMQVMSPVDRPVP